MTVGAGYPGSITSCTDFGAYHQAVQGAEGEVITYAVIPYCDNYLGNGGLPFVTSAASHELIESATDPDGIGSYVDVPFTASGWALTVGGSEVADLCKLNPSSNVIPSDLPYTVQRVWSDSMAAADHDPCVPSLPAQTPYFNASPDLTAVDDQTAPGLGQGVYFDGVDVPPGGATTIAVHLFSDGPTSGPWQLSAAEKGSPQSYSDPEHLLSFSFDKDSGVNGDTVHLTIHRAKSTKGADLQVLPFVIESTLDGVTNPWWSATGTSM